MVNWKNKEEKLKYHKDFNKKYYIENKKEVDKKHREYYADNNEKRTLKINEWRENNKQKVIDYSNNWNKRNRDKVNEWAKDNKDKISAYLKKYRNTDKGKLNKLIRKARERNANLNFNISKKELTEIIERDKVCIYCNRKRKLTFEHIIPIVKNGLTIKNNIVMACLSCNSSKMDKNVFEWTKQKGYPLSPIIKSNLQKMKVGLYN